MSVLPWKKQFHILLIVKIYQLTGNNGTPLSISAKTQPAAQLSIEGP